MFSLKKLDKIINDIINSINFTPQNYKKILEENITLKQNSSNYQNSLVIQEENNCLKIENAKLLRKYNYLLNVMKLKNELVNELIEKDDNNTIINSVDIPIIQNIINNVKPPEINSNENITTKLKRLNKNNDGLYHVNDKAYKNLIGTREEVWNETAYKTSGGLIKDNLLKNVSGKIVSKSKYICSKIDSNLGVLTTQGRGGEAPHRAIM
jgi:hypothetical protein